MAADLSGAEVERAKFVFSIFDFEGKNKMDAMYLGKALRALDLSPTVKTTVTLGKTNRHGEKYLTVEEFLAVYNEAKKENEIGSSEDYLEVFKSFDKDEKGKITTDTLAHILQGYGERLDKDEVESIVDDCGNVDEDGCIRYKSFLSNLMKGPPEDEAPPAV